MTSGFFIMKILYNCSYPITYLNNSPPRRSIFFPSLSVLCSPPLAFHVL